LVLLLLLLPWRSARDFLAATAMLAVLLLSLLATAARFLVAAVAVAVAGTAVEVLPRLVFQGHCNVGSVVDDAVVLLR